MSKILLLCLVCEVRFSWEEWPMLLQSRGGVRQGYACILLQDPLYLGQGSVKPDPDVDSLSRRCADGQDGAWILTLVLDFQLFGRTDIDENIEQSFEGASFRSDVDEDFDVVKIVEIYLFASSLCRLAAELLEQDEII
jgi:hypothetical protein